MQGEDAVRSFAKRMPEASDKGSQPYRNAVRCFEMAGKEMPPNNISLPLGRRHELRMSLTYGKVPGVWCRSYQPFRGA